MLDANQRRIAWKEHSWERIRRGEIMTLTIDSETGGVTRSDRPYATPNYPFITEYGDSQTDLAGNYINSAQIFPRRPEWLMPEPAAAILQRLPIGPQDYDSPERMSYWNAMAAIIYRIESAALAYKDFGDKTQYVRMRDYNKQFKGGSKPASEDVIPIPLRQADGTIVYDARFHPERGKVSYRIDDDPKSKYYEPHDNLYYVDEEDGSRWRWVDARLTIDGYNFNPYDLPIFRTNFYRVGFDTQDATFMYSRATLTNKQRQKNHLIDVRNLAYAVALYGPQGEDGLKLGELIDPQTGKIRASEALSAYLERNKRHANPLRMLRGGAFMPTDGSMHDKALDHGAAYDAAGTAALRNLCWDIAPDICAILESQADERKLYQMLTEQPARDDKMPLFSLPRRANGTSHGENPYWFLGTDDQIGRFKRMVFLLADGNLHKTTFRGKSIKDLDVDEWVEFMKSAEGSGPDSPVRIVSLRKWQSALPIEDVFKRTSLGTQYRNNSEAMLRDCDFINANPDMRANIMAAQEKLQRALRFTPGPQIEFLEDELPRLFSGEVHYQDEAIEIAKMEGSQRIAQVLETIKGGMDNVYKTYMREMDRSMRMLCLKALPIDYAHAYKDELPEHIQRGILENFTDLCNRIHAKARAKEWPYVKVLDSIINPATGEPFFENGSFSAEDVSQAFAFRTLLGERAMADYVAELHTPGSSYIDGYVDQDFCRRKNGRQPLFLFADPDNGEKGAMPHIVDKAGREIDLAYIKAQSMDDVLRLLEKGQWSYRFYRLSSEPTIMRLMHRFIDLGMRDKIPADLYELYEIDKYHRIKGFPNETETTDRVPTQRTFLRDLKRLEQSATTRNSLLLERDPNPQMGEAARRVQNDEGQRILANCRKWIRKHLKANPDRPELVTPGRFDPESGLPFDFIKFQVHRNENRNFDNDPNFLVIDVPAWHLRYPVEQFDVRLPHRCVVVPKIAEAGIKAIAAGKPVILRESETGRLYHPGRVTVHAAPALNDPAHSIIMEKAAGDYLRAGKALTPRQKLSVLGIEGLFPLANTRDVDRRAQSFKLPSLHFDGLVYPQISSLGARPLTSLVIPIDYCPQVLEKDKPIRLAEMDAEMFSNIEGDAAPDTGHMYETTLRDVIGIDSHGRRTGITLDEFNRRAKNGTISPDIIKGAGFLSADHIDARLNQWATGKWRANPGQQKVLVATFDEVNRKYKKTGNEAHNSWAFRNPPEAPMAALVRGGKPVGPSAYRDYWKAPKNGAA